MPVNTKKIKRNPDNKRDESVSLSLPDRFYIENNGNLSIEQLAHDLAKPIDVVKDYCEAWLKANPPKKKYRARDLMSRPSKTGGVISMTEAASMVGDEAYGRFVTLEDINEAEAVGNTERVKMLKKQYEEQEQQNRQVIKTKYSDMIHYIDKPHPDAEVY